MAVLSPSPAAASAVDAPQQEVESALTDRYQTTVPQPVRRALGLRKRDRIRYAFRSNGEVVLERVSPEPDDDDPALAPFLALLGQDIASHPERLKPITADLVSRMQDLVDGIEVDLDASLPDDDETGCGDTDFGSIGCGDTI
ncbi:type II toxin-antitoxin system PrlF family antitoxin [Synechococcus sp. CS-1328]|uniref:type II toxin-antitoxin system PrlF family antitoxin n=1 Tax=Synechococcus sp. CS-1328 TaxID=2847976 RepID=UPI00223BDF44|nr:type II toxin-antitoxin system PrlF family antitoxin [Synechococcus sp. CS-1328]MCT0224878.1 type II toxin-antitoxin system PrlF family antitoxin [Synechococcus sp. CS-1328]